MGSGGHLGGGPGIVWALLAAITYAIGVLCQKLALKRLPVAQVTWLGCVFGTLACLPFLGSLIHDLRLAPTGAILGAVYLGVVPTALAFSMWAYALSKMPAGQLGVTTYIVPAIVVLLGFAVFHESRRRSPSPAARSACSASASAGNGAGRRKTPSAPAPAGIEFGCAALPAAPGQTCTVTRRKVAGMDVSAGSLLWFWLAKSAFELLLELSRPPVLRRPRRRSSSGRSSRGRSPRTQLACPEIEGEGVLLAAYGVGLDTGGDETLDHTALHAPEHRADKAFGRRRV